MWSVKLPRASESGSTTVSSGASAHGSSKSALFTSTIRRGRRQIFIVAALGLYMERHPNSTLYRSARRKVYGRIGACDRPCVDLRMVAKN